MIDPHDYDKDSWLGLSKPDNPINIVNENLTAHPISASGDHCLKIRLAWHGHKKPIHIKYDLVSFRAIAHETMIGWTIGILLGIGAIVVGILNLIYRL